MGKTTAGSKKTALIVGCSIGALLLGVCGVGLVVFLLLGSSSPTTRQYQLSPSNETTVLKYGDYSVNIPGGTVQQPEMLRIAPVKGLAQALAEFEPVCPPFDVKLGSLTQFTEPIGIEIPYDKARIRDLEPGGAFVAVYYDESGGTWKDVPYEVDETKGVVRLLMYHLSTVQLYYSTYEQGMVYDNGTVSVIYKYDASGELRQKYQAYEQAVGRYGNDSGAPQFVIDLADNAAVILQAYAGAGLKVPQKPKIYVTASGNAYNSITGNVSVSLDIITQADPEQLMLRNLAHELFHGAQRETMGSADYELTRAKNSSFWMEATADFMANTGFWKLAGLKAVNKYEYYATDFFEKSLYTMDGSHEYDAASFVKFVQNDRKVTPKQMVTMAGSFSSFPQSFDSVYGSLDDSYLNFMEFSLFDNASMLKAKSNGLMEKWITRMQALQFPQDPAGTCQPPALEGSGSLAFSGEYTAGFFRFSTNCDTTLTVTPDSDLILYRLNRNRSERGYDLRVEAFAGAATQIDFGKDEFVLAAQVSPLAGALNFNYKAEPASVDLSGRWDITKFVTVDIEGSDEFFALMQKQYGVDKPGLIASANQELGQATSFLVLTQTGDGPVYKIEIGSSKAEGTLVFKNVPFVNNRLKATSSYNNLQAELNLVVNGNKITGSLRTEVRVMVGDQSASAMQVNEITAGRAE